ncbi:hypothetical protein TRFO_02994 [Tritrichomonas foetus]|uniref:Uncharacterized protein n=1 Tax=Tritrichomonas foetus TaxID=1144522 RepID=A0A1J4KTZ8_9EUKA|nr:hypothetical protein TRFO_02994 [Tritrichomonas foetus]|eukprot:OHT14735.1 hypothetical protein TRFO_02994 [Tritrichomonas foetus]
MPYFTNVRWGLIMVAAITMGLFALGMVYAFKKGTITINSPESMILYSDQSLPTSFIFSNEYDTPRQTHSNEWIGATIDFIHSTYRSHGIRNGFLHKDFYLEFNSSFYLDVIKNYCEEIGFECEMKNISENSSQSDKKQRNLLDLKKNLKTNIFKNSKKIQRSSKQNSKLHYKYFSSRNDAVFTNHKNYRKFYYDKNTKTFIKEESNNNQETNNKINLLSDVTKNLYKSIPIDDYNENKQISIQQSSNREFYKTNGFNKKTKFGENIELDKNVENDNNCQFMENKYFVAADFPKLFEKMDDLDRLFISGHFCSINNCSDLQKVIQSNPIILEPISYSWASTVNDIKQLLSESENPLLLSIPQPIEKYYLPCSDSRVNCSIYFEKCPSFIQSEKCGILSFLSELSNAEFYQPSFPAIPDVGPPLTFLLFGWNDDFVTKVSKFQSNAQSNSLIKVSNGGFIVKRTAIDNRKTKGNALGYFDGSLLFGDNDKMCGSQNNPQKWKANDLLKCINPSLCDTRYNYTMYVQENGEHVVNNDKYGMTLTKMYKWKRTNENKSKNKNENNEDALPFDEIGELFDYDLVPYHHLDIAFNLLFEENQTYSSACSYWFLPYDVVEELDSIGSPSMKKVHAVNFAVKWSKGSYQKKNEVISSSLKKIYSRNVTTL